MHLSIRETRKINADLEKRIVDAIKTLESKGSISNVKRIAEVIGNHKIMSLECYITKILKNKYEDRILKIREDYNFDVPLTQPLREDLGLYTGNLYKAKEVYWSLKSNQKDFLRNIRVPFKIDEKIAELFGVMWGDGHYRDYNNKRKLDLIGREKHREFYEKDLPELLRYAFNFSPNLHSGKPKIEITSEAIITWLIDYLGFPKNNKGIDLPKIDFDKKLATAFYRGLLKVASNKFAQGNISIIDKNYSYITKLKLLGLKHFGVSPYIIEDRRFDSYRLCFSISDQKKLKLFNVI